jgi:competence protein ComEA
VEETIESLRELVRKNLRWLIAAGLAVFLAALWLSDRAVQETVATPEATSEVTFLAVRVHVVGEVVAPGLYELAGGSIAADAIAAAGGLTAEAAQESVNLAKMLSDGEQLRVFGKSEFADVLASVGALSLRTDLSGSLGIHERDGELRYFLAGKLSA